ncbi:MAG: hypothetical protein R3181_04270, partial [Rubricoccaceae bacterium]|nr:hypothetical protein [Rubricoccaceae bacterium]
MRPPFLVALVLLASAPVLAQPAAPAPADGALHLGEAAAPLQFAENRGQWPAEVLFQARLGNSTAWVTREGVVFDFYETVAAEGTDASRPPRGENPVGRHGHVVAMRFLGGTAGRAIGHGRQPATHSYFLGGDPTRWAGRVALFDEVVLQDLYEGIDLRLYGDGGRLRYDLVLAPGTDPAQVRMRMDGAEAVALTAGGALRLATRLGPVEHRGLAAYQVNRQGHREAVGAAFTVDAEETVGFAVDRTDPRRPLVIDPLVWATFLGGSEGRENVTAIAVGADGVTVAGSTTSADLPTTLGAYDESSNGAEDAFVARLSADGATLVWATFLGGGDLDKATALGVAADGAATVAGWTFGDGFPTTPGAFDTSFNSACCFSDAFVTRLSADGSHLVYSTFLGGFESDYALGLALGPDGDATVGGATASADFPTTPGVVDPFFDGGAFGDGFVTRLSADGSALLYSTFLGGAETDEVTAVARADDGSALAVGLTESADFPATPGAFASAAAGGTDAFAARLAPGGDALHYATFLGGASFDDARGVT